MVYCIVFGCDATKCYKTNKDDKVPIFHHFPTSTEQRGAWLLFCRRSVHKIDLRRHYICSRHFKDKDYYYYVNNYNKIKKKLKRDAVPTQNPPPPRDRERDESENEGKLKRPRDDQFKDDSNFENEEPRDKRQRISTPFIVITAYALQEVYDQADPKKVSFELCPITLLPTQTNHPLVVVRKNLSTDFQKTTDSSGEHEETTQKGEATKPDPSTQLSADIFPARVNIPTSTDEETSQENNKATNPVLFKTMCSPGVKAPNHTPLHNEMASNLLLETPGAVKMSSASTADQEKIRKNKNEPGSVLSTQTNTVSMPSIANKRATQKNGVPPSEANISFVNVFETYCKTVAAVPQNDKQLNAVPSKQAFTTIIPPKISRSIIFYRSSSTMIAQEASRDIAPDSNPISTIMRSPRDVLPTASVKDNMSPSLLLAEPTAPTNVPVTATQEKASSTPLCDKPTASTTEVIKVTLQKDEQADQGPLSKTFEKVLKTYCQDPDRLPHQRSSFPNEKRLADDFEAICKRFVIIPVQENASPKETQTNPVPAKQIYRSIRLQVDNCTTSAEEIRDETVEEPTRVLSNPTTATLCRSLPTAAVQESPRLNELSSPLLANERSTKVQKKISNNEKEVSMKKAIAIAPKLTLREASQQTNQTNLAPWKQIFDHIVPPGVLGKAAQQANKTSIALPKQIVNIIEDKTLASPAQKTCGRNIDESNPVSLNPTTTRMPTTGVIVHTSVVQVNPRQNKVSPNPVLAKSTEASTNIIPSAAVVDSIPTNAYGIRLCPLTHKAVASRPTTAVKEPTQETKQMNLAPRKLPPSADNTFANPIQKTSQEAEKESNPTTAAISSAGVIMHTSAVRDQSRKNKASLDSGQSFTQQKNEQEADPGPSNPTTPSVLTTGVITHTSTVQDNHRPNSPVVCKPTIQLGVTIPSTTVQRKIHEVEGKVSSGLSKDIPIGSAPITAVEEGTQANVALAVQETTQKNEEEAYPVLSVPTNNAMNSTENPMPSAAIQDPPPSQFPILSNPITPTMFSPGPMMLNAGQYNLLSAPLLSQLPILSNTITSTVYSPGSIMLMSAVQQNNLLPSQLLGTLIPLKNVLPGVYVPSFIPTTVSVGVNVLSTNLPEMTSQATNLEYLDFRSQKVSYCTPGNTLKE